MIEDLKKEILPVPEAPPPAPAPKRKEVIETERSQGRNESFCHRPPALKRKGASHAPRVNAFEKNQAAATTQNEVEKKVSSLARLAVRSALQPYRILKAEGVIRFQVNLSKNGKARVDLQENIFPNLNSAQRKAIGAKLKSMVESANYTKGAEFMKSFTLDFS